MDIDWKEVGLVVGAGALGGGVSLVYALTMGNPPVIETFPWAILAYLILGAAAAPFGVYVVAGTDTRQARRCLFFALACGVFWAPMFDATRALVEKRGNEALEATAKKQIKATLNAIAALKESSQEELSSAASSVVQKVRTLVDATSKVNDVSTVAAAHNSIEKVIKSLDEVRGRNPEVISKAIEEIHLAIPAPSDLYMGRGPVMQPSIVERRRSPESPSRPE